MKANSHFMALCLRMFWIGLTHLGFFWALVGCGSGVVKVVPLHPIPFEQLLAGELTAEARRPAHGMAQWMQASLSARRGILNDDKLPEPYMEKDEPFRLAAKYHLSYAALRLIREHYAASHPRSPRLSTGDLVQVVEEAGGNTYMVHEFDRDRFVYLADVRERSIFEIVSPGQAHGVAAKNKVDGLLLLLNNGMLGVPPFKLGTGYAGEVGVRFAERAAPWKLSWQTIAPGIIEYRWQVLSVVEEGEEAAREAYVENRWHAPTLEEMVRFARALQQVVEALVQVREELGQTRAALKMPILPGATLVEYFQAIVWWSVNDDEARLLPVVRPDPRLLAQPGAPGGAPALPLLTTRELRRIYGNPGGLAGIQYNRDVGVMFQRLVLAHMPGPKMVYANTKPFASPEREARTQGRYKSVIPDGVAGASIGSRSPLGAIISTYPESTFIEVKAVKGKITRSYGQYQIWGMLDALSHSQAAQSKGDDRAFPNMVFVTTGDTLIGPDVVDEATRLNILVWLSFVMVHPNDEVQVAPPACLNCGQVLLGNVQTQGFVLPGVRFRLKSQPSPRVPVLFDPPILDDGLVGDPGVAGPTTPNP